MRLDEQTPRESLTITAQCAPRTHGAGRTWPGKTILLRPRRPDPALKPLAPDSGRLLPQNPTKQHLAPADR